MEATTETTEVKTRQNDAIKLGYITYGLYAASLLIGITGLIAFILNFLSKDKVKGTIVETHYAYQKKTFLTALIAEIIGFITIIVGVGLVISVVAYLWYAYRIVKGGWYLYDGKPVDPDKWF